MAFELGLDGLIAVVTGAGGGIGRATSVALGQAGVRVLLVDKEKSSLKETQLAVTTGGGEAESIVADVTRAEEVSGYVDAATSKFGGIDIFFNNAGIEGVVANLVDYPVDVFDAVLAVNLRGVFLGLRYVLPVMIAQGSGSIINTSSLAGERGLPGTVAYNAAKHGVQGLTRTAAAEVASAGVRVNAVCPGFVDTRMLHSLVSSMTPGEVEEGLATFAASSPGGRLGTAEEIAAVVCFLASPVASYVNGACWPVDGGILATISTPR
jgi:NAD(P)-dependent dehydrogenase (short-subunit alcohol dehydrogenase family)